MKIQLILGIAIFGLAAFSASAQTKIAVINSDAFFDQKTGITKLIAAQTALNAQFAPARQELQTLSTKLSALSKEIDTLRKQTGVPVNERVLQAKVDEGTELQRNIKYKQEDAQAQFDKARATAITPITQDIGNVLRDFAKTNGYALVFDYSKDQNGFLIAVGDDKADITKSFIAFYNSRPATPVK